jgi:hypothetical protein
MRGNNCAARVFLLAFISATLPTLIRAQCNPANPTACTSCQSCTGTGINQAHGVWYSTQQDCGSSSGFCASSTAEIPCFAPRGARYFFTRGDSFGGSCSNLCSSTSSIGNLATLPGYCPTSDSAPLSCSVSNIGACASSPQCFGEGSWYNSDRSPDTTGLERGLCLPDTATPPCDSWRIKYNGGGITQLSNTDFCFNRKSCNSCTEAQGFWLKYPDNDGGRCSSSQSTCTTPELVFRTGFDFPCSSVTSKGLCSKCKSGDSCDPKPKPTPAPLPTPAPTPTPTPARIVSSSSPVVVSLSFVVAALLALM